MKLNLKRRILLMGYALGVFIIGILKVPMKELWKKEIQSVGYNPIWKYISNHNINGDWTFYQVDIKRLVVELIVITIIMFTLYIILDEKERENKDISNSEG